MRENWRIRKINNAVFGDLSYRICKLFLNLNEKKNLFLLLKNKFTIFFFAINN